MSNTEGAKYLVRGLESLKENGENVDCLWSGIRPLVLFEADGKTYIARVKEVNVDFEERN